MSAEEFYNHTTYPTTGSLGVAAELRVELDLIEAGFGKLPDLSGNGSKIVAINSGATTLEAITTTGTGSGVRATSPTLVTPLLGTPTSGVATNLTGTAAGLTAGNVTTNANLTGHVTSVGNAAVLGSFTSAQLATALTDETGSGAAVFATSPTLVTPALGTPSSGVATNLTGTAAGLTAGNVTTNANLTGHVTSVGNAAVLGSFTSAQLATALTDETGSGAAVFATSPTLVTPALGTPSSGNLANCTAYPGTSALVTTGALNSGSITSGFGSIDVGTDAITGGAVSGTTITGTGAVTGLTGEFGTATNSVYMEGRTDGPSGATNYSRIGGLYTTNPIPGAAIGFLAEGAAGQRGEIGLYTKSLEDNTTQPVLRGRITQNGSFVPEADNVSSLGTAALKFSEVNAVLGTFTGIVSAVTNAGPGRGVLIRAPSGDATPAVLQFTNHSIGVEWASIAATNGVLTFNVASAVFTGALTSSSPTGGIGYAAGAGGSVTQLTSLGTGVTLNTICGEIILVSAAVTAGAETTFGFTNSNITAKSVIAFGGRVVGGSELRFLISASNMTAGSCFINLVPQVSSTGQNAINFMIFNNVTT